MCVVRVAGFDLRAIVSGFAVSSLGWIVVSQARAEGTSARG